MQPQFWLDRWADNRIGFHHCYVNPVLVQYWSSLALASDARVLVPLCGKSLDLAWLSSLGHRVLGVELSQKAVEDFFSEHKLVPQISQHGAFTVYEAGLIQLWCGNVFALQAEDVLDCHGLYDRAALIALPEQMREQYVAHLDRILAPGCRGLLITLNYDQAQKDGPPFVVSEPQLRQLFGLHWRIELLVAQDILAESQKFRQEGLTQLEERVYRLTKD